MLYIESGRKFPTLKELPKMTGNKIHRGGGGAGGLLIPQLSILYSALPGIEHSVTNIAGCSLPNPLLLTTLYRSNNCHFFRVNMLHRVLLIQ